LEITALDIDKSKRRDMSH